MSTNNNTRLHPALARSYEKYGEDVRNGVAGRVVTSTEYGAKGMPGGRSGDSTFGLDSRGLKGKVVKTASGGRKFVGVPLQKRDHYLPKDYVGPSERKAREEQERAAVEAFFAKGGKVNHV